MDVIITEGREQGAVNLGIYMLDGDTLRLCIGKTRPQKFESVAGAGDLLLLQGTFAGDHHTSP
jgi:hypothetical protein